MPYGPARSRDGCSLGYIYPSPRNHHRATAPPPPRAVVEETLLEMWYKQKASLQRIAPNVSHLQCHPIAEVIDAHNQKIAVRQVAGVADACCT